MKIKIILGILGLAMAATSLTSCDTDAEAIVLKGQKPYVYSEQYYENLRAFKKTNHEISYAYFAAWAPLEGVSGYKDPASWGERFIGMPDSLDICNLWMGIPTKDEHPVAYKDMIETREKKGTRFVFHADASNFNHSFWYRDSLFNVKKDSVVNLRNNRSEAALRAYARWVVDTVMQCELDGVDFDFEGWDSGSMATVTNECMKYFGVNGTWPEKLFIIDYFGGNPDTRSTKYCDYVIKQAYSAQGSGVGAGSGIPDEKMVYCESMDQKPSGGEVLNYARWEPSSGHKGGCGAYYMDNNYDASPTGKTFWEFRQAIQIMNPALNK
jgi:hypothetical protein